MKKISIFICMIILIFVFACLEYYFRSFEIADGVKIKRMVDGNYYIIYKGRKVGGVVTAVDSWYIHQHYIHGSTTIKNTSDNIIYFIIDVCSKEVYQTEYSSKFYSYLEEKNIPKDQIGNYMSGDNIVDMRTHKNKYSYEYKCP